MALLDKTFNNVMNIENFEVTPEELVRLMEENLLPLCDEKELKKLQKGLKKTWYFWIHTVFGVKIAIFGGYRYYPDESKNVRMVMNIGLLGRLKQISLFDGENKTEYFLYKGKANRQLFQGLAQSAIEKHM